MTGNYGADPDYVRSSFKIVAHGLRNITHDKQVSAVSAYSSNVVEDDFVQARGVWKLIGKQEEQEILINNFSGQYEERCATGSSEDHQLVFIYSFSCEHYRSEDIEI